MCLGVIAALCSHPLHTLASSPFFPPSLPFFSLFFFTKTMSRRPPSTAASSNRPYTSAGIRPPTAGIFDRDPQYTYSLDEEDDDESEDEDVFAFLPPSTAEQQQQRLHEEQQLQHQQDHHPNPARPILKPSPDPIFANDPSRDTSIPFPSPTFNPHARFPADSPPGPHFPYLPPPQTPPSTESHSHSQDDPYRMRRINTVNSAHNTGTGTTGSREVHVALPSTGVASEKGSDAARPEPKRNTSSITESMSMSPSMLDEDDYSATGEGSIK